VTPDPFFDTIRRGLQAFMSLVAGGVSAGLIMLGASLFAGPYGLIIGVPALLIWPIGMLVIGAPVWAILHWRGLRSRSVARTAGVAGGAASVLLMAALIFGPSGGWIMVLLLTLAGAVSGIVGGHVVWTLAYGGRDVRAA